MAGGHAPPFLFRKGEATVRTRKLHVVASLACREDKMMLYSLFMIYFTRSKTLGTRQPLKHKMSLLYTVCVCDQLNLNLPYI